jgi:hypothetical protein
MTDVFTTSFAPVNVAATALLLMIVLYWLFVIIGAGSLDLFELELDFETDLDASMSLGMVTLDFLNIGRMPLMIWLSAFALAWWGISVAWDHPDNHTSWYWGLQAAVRNFALAVIAAKLITQPLRNRFDPHEPNRPEELIGKEAVITSSNVTEQFGQARLQTEAAPLLLHVRSADPQIAKGDRVTLVDYDFEKRYYLVAKYSNEAV